MQRRCDRARAALEQSFDARFGGFGGAPKFPHPGSVERCLRHWHATSPRRADLEALFMASLTLTRMAEGGIYDQLGGGFSRYSVDDAWMIPHFEKMLYDNGQLLGTYAAAAAATGERLVCAHRRRNRRLGAARHARTGRRLLFEPRRGFAGPRGEVLRLEPIRGAGAVDASPSTRCLRAASDSMKPPTSRANGTFTRVAALEAGPAAEPTAAASLLESARAKLLAARNLRVWPARDEKILTAWNALMIKGLAIAARVLHRPDLADAATAAVDFIHRTLWRDGRLLATYKDGRAHLPAYLDDYAFLADALLELLQTRWRSRDLEFAQALVEVMLSSICRPR